jgi:hypothetical protein
MPWQERDWAKWTDEERNRFLGTSGNRGGGGTTTRPPADGSVLNRPLSKETRSPSAGQAQGLVVPTPEPVLPSPKRATKPPPAARVSPPKHRSMQLPSSLRRGTSVTSSGTLGTNVSGPVIVKGRWGSGPWYRLASANATNGAYRVRYLLDRPGLVHLRIALPDGNYLVGTVRIT